MASIWGRAMTDAALSVTQSVVERFTDQYLCSLGCKIEKEGDRWDVVVPTDVDTDLFSGELTLYCGEDVVSDESNQEPLYPDSQFFQQLLTEASKQAPTGKVSINTERTETKIPAWIQNGDVELVDSCFTPYYDRTALVILFQVSIETVSEYQSELLRAIAVDTHSEEVLPQLEDTFLKISTSSGDGGESTQSELTESDVQPLLNLARQELVDRIQETVDEIHQEASRAADAEVEEYRQMQQQRLEELEEKHSNLSSKIDDLRETINTGEQDDRVQALKKRKELKSEYEEVDSELTDLRQRRDQGFPEKQQEIRQRHAVNVRVRPLTVTEVEYERGEIEFEFLSGEITQSMTVGYGSGIGITDEVQCPSCSQKLTQNNLLRSNKDGIGCTKCNSATD